MTHETLLEVALRTLSKETTARVRAQAKVERLQRQLSRLKAAADPGSCFAELSPKTGLPRDVVVRAYVRSDRKAHRPQLEKYLALLAR